MEYMGAADYYFWNGVYIGHNSSKLSDIDLVKPTFAIHNTVTIECSNAFNWGFCLGLELTEEEYKELTTPISSSIIEESSYKKEVNVNMVGNC